MGPFRALTFDCYGTLIDWETGILSALRPWATRSGVNAADEALLAAFAASESAEERADPGANYRDILRRVMTRLGVELGGSVTDADREALAGGVGSWPAFPDSAEALRRLKSRHRLIITSNVDRASFAGSASQLGDPFDAVITAEDVGSYKPALGHFVRAEALMRERGWITDRSQWLHVAQSLYHDHVPAKALGLTTAWIDRRGGRSGGATPEASGVSPDIVCRSLAELADRLGC